MFYKLGNICFIRLALGADLWYATKGRTRPAYSEQRVLLVRQKTCRVPSMSSRSLGADLVPPDPPSYNPTNESFVQNHLWSRHIVNTSSKMIRLVALSRDLHNLMSPTEAHLPRVPTIVIAGFPSLVTSRRIAYIPINSILHPLCPRF
jgi:hypothetical protein